MRYPISLALAAIVIVIACTNFQEEEVPVSFGVNLSELSYDTASSLRPVVVSSGTKWTVASMPAWMSLQSINPSGRSPYEWTANFMAEANDGYNREGRIVINAKGESAEIAVTQDGKKGKYVAVESVSISPSTLTLTEGESSTLTYTISPSNASEKGVTWKSSSPSVATVSESGEVEALAVGTTTITITTEDGGKTSSCEVTVKAKVIPVQSVSLNKTSLTMTVGDTQTLTATVTPDNATDKSVTWSSTDTSVAEVSTSGLVIAKSTGEATIMVATNDHAKTAICKVTVLPISVTGISLNRSSLSMYENDTEILTATVIPSNATNKSVQWSSGNSSVVTVDSNGRVAAKAAGSAVITVTTNDGKKTANCSVSVKSDPYGAVDLGLSVKWAPYNYGASAENEVGGYYKWGDPTGQAAGYSFSPPNVDSICGTQYDVVRKHWGGDWRIPTADEIRELKNNCTLTWTNVGGVSGVRFTGKNGNSIFLPVSGFAYHSTQWETSETTGYTDTDKAYLMAGTSYYDSTTWQGRVTYLYVFSAESFTRYILHRVSNDGYPIRPVR